MAFVDEGVTATIAASVQIEPSMEIRSQGLRIAAPLSVVIDLVGDLRLISARALSNVKIKVEFDALLRNDAALQSATSYSIVATSPGGAPVFVKEIDIPFDESEPSSVTLLTTEMTNDAQYRLELIGPIKALSGAPLAPAQTANFVGIGLPPSIKLVVAKDANTVDVEFNDSMEDNADIRNTARYSFDNGLVVNSVESVSGNVVRLKTSSMTADLVYTLTVYADFAQFVFDDVAVSDSTTVRAEGDIVVDGDGVIIDADQVIGGPFALPT